MKSFVLFLFVSLTPCNAVAVIDAPHKPTRFAVQKFNSTTNSPFSSTNDPRIRNRKVLGAFCVLTALFASTKSPRDDESKEVHFYPPEYELTGEASVTEDAKTIFYMSFWGILCFYVLSLKW